MKDCAGRGGASSSIPAGNNGAAGQECFLQEEEVRGHSHASTQRSHARLQGHRQSFLDGGQNGEAGGSMRGSLAACLSILGVWGVEGGGQVGSNGGASLCEKVGQSCLYLTHKQTPLYTSMRRRDTDAQ